MEKVQLKDIRKWFPFSVTFWEGAVLACYESVSNCHFSDKYGYLFDLLSIYKGQISSIKQSIIMKSFPISNFQKYIKKNTEMLYQMVLQFGLKIWQRKLFNCEVMYEMLHICCFWNQVSYDHHRKKWMENCLTTLKCCYPTLRHAQFTLRSLWCHIGVTET